MLPADEEVLDLRKIGSLEKTMLAESLEEVVSSVPVRVIPETGSPSLATELDFWIRWGLEVRS